MAPARILNYSRTVVFRDLNGTHEQKVTDAFYTLVQLNGGINHVDLWCAEDLFSFEIYFKRAKLHIEGLGGSYGVERLYYYKMLPEMGAAGNGYL
jgi:hypothetical protein